MAELKIEAWTVQDGNDKGRIGLKVPMTMHDQVKKIPGCHYERSAGVGQRYHSMPKSWPAVLALGSLAKQFGYKLERSDELRDWMLARATEWKDLRRLSATIPPPGTRKDPDARFYPHQEMDAEWLTYPSEEMGRLLLSSTGIGKTMAVVRAMEMLKAKDDLPGPVLITCPEAVMKTGWMDTFSNFAPDFRAVEIVGTPTKRRKLLEEVREGLWDVAVIGHSNLKSHTKFEAAPGQALVKCVACGGPRLTKNEMDEEGNLIPTVDPETGKEIKEISTARCQAHRKELNEIGWSVVVVDECFVPTALVDTPNGPRPIGELVVGDQVWGYDESQGTVVSTSVTTVMTREADVIGGFVTGDHPVRVAGDAYRPIVDMRSNDEVFWRVDDHSGVPTVRRGLFGECIETQEPWSQVLQQIMHGEVSFCENDSRTERVISTSDECFTQQTRGSREVGGTSSWRNQSVQGSCCTAARSENLSGARLGKFDWWKWPTFEQTGNTSVGFVGAGVENRACSANSWLPRATSSSWVQSRFGFGSSEVGSRSRRNVSFISDAEGTGSKEKSSVELGRMDGSEIREPRDFARSERVRSANLGDSRAVVNIETGTSNYFVHGLLVHNCHRAMNSRSQLTQAIWGVNTWSPTKTRRWGLTGTIISKHTEQVWAPLHYTSPEGWPVKTKWIEWYCSTGFDYYGYFKVTGLKPEKQDEFQAVFSGISRRVLKEQVLEGLPPKLRWDDGLMRELSMHGEQLRAYDEMRKEMTVMVDEGRITAANVAVQAGRLCMMAAGTGYPHPDNLPGGPQKMLLRAPSVKLDEITTMLKNEEFGDSQVGFLFSSSTALHMYATELIDKGLMRADDIALISGKVSKRDRDWAMTDFQAGKRRYVLLTYAAGGTGVTLNAANQVVVVQRDWSPINNAQGIDRFHRIGSEKFDNVTYYDLVVANSLEVAQVERMRTDAETLEEIVQDRQRLKAVLGL